MRTVVFLGGGRITSAMLAGLRLGKSKYHFVIHDRHSEKVRGLCRKGGIAPETNLDRAVAQADVLIVAVRPDSVHKLLQAIGELKRPLLAVSLAAGVPLRALKGWLGPPVRWVRAMPSPICRSGHGLTALSFPKGSRAQDRKLVRGFFESFGQVIEMPEHKFDAFTVTYSCSHGYHALATLAKAGQAAGLDRKSALIASAHALAAGITAWSDGNEPLEALLEEAATPGGIAATTMVWMDAAGYGRAVRAGVRAGLRRARANARG